MLPYTPLHHLLLGDAGGPLVMTSGNVSRRADRLPRRRRARAAGARSPTSFLLHDRPIHTRTDDSVVRASSARRPLVLRRSRGYVPGARRRCRSRPSAPVLACGAELKSTFCLAAGARAWVGHHIGDLGNCETLRSFREGVAHFERLFAVEPEVVAHDLHPDYLSTRYALEREGVEPVGGASTTTRTSPRAWPSTASAAGGRGDLRRHRLRPRRHGLGRRAPRRRPARVRARRPPAARCACRAATRAAREPWRMACAWLRAAARRRPARPPALAGADPATLARRRAAGRAPARCAGHDAAPAASSTPSPRSAACAPRVDYEGQAAIELEAVARPGRARRLRARCDGRSTRGRRARRARGRRRGRRPALVAARFHNGLARRRRDALRAAARAPGRRRRRALRRRLPEPPAARGRAARLRRAGLRVLVPAALPPNDGGIAYGQAPPPRRRRMCAHVTPPEAP